MSRTLTVLPALLLAASCGPSTSPATIEFAPVWASKPISCTTAAGGLLLTDLRFYISNVEMIDASGAAHPVRLDETAWQSTEVALLDFEDGSGACENGTAETNETLHFQLAGHDYIGIRLQLGVPFELNHADPLQASPPLDDSAMHWHWRSGYKFIRAGVSSETDGFWLHTGSAGCEGTVQNISGCRFPNRVTIELPDFRVDKDRVLFDFAALLKGTDLTDALPGDCSSGPAEAACSAPFAALGIDFATGERAAAQAVFRATPK